MRTEKILGVQKISKKYGEHTVVKDVSFDLYKGEIISFIGPNGAGKTTLLKILSGFLSSDSGSLKIKGNDLTNQLNQLNHQVSTVFGGGTGFYKNASIEENLDFFATLEGLKRAQAQRKIEEVLEIVELTEHRNKRVSALSMGMLQRLHIARGLLKDCSILLLDEPTNGVDAEMSQDIRATIKEIAKSGKSIILTSHILHEVSDMASRIFLLTEGKVAFMGDLASIIEESGIRHIDRPATLEESYLGLIAKLGGNHG
ncbi:MAG: ABC transporter ATP-binding protein [Streptococcaceae bacterium]|jgi:ABC-2 type transport system ATP-binding protein|nr:ABC transporter ATP-binding protein [Streptococcaceae bacterium]